MEKALKALLVLRSVQVPRTHAISELMTMLAELGFDIPADVQEASALTDYAVAARYPGPAEPVLADGHEKAVAIAAAVVAWARRIVTTPAEQTTPEALTPGAPGAQGGHDESWSDTLEPEDETRLVVARGSLRNPAVAPRWR